MTIKEIESLAGMTRANVRFYEAEGLLHPRRLENGYRDYTEDDLTALMRIRLLRALGMPLDDIRALQSGQAQLGDALERQLAALSAEQDALTRSMEVCRAIRADGGGYDTLDARRWLEALEGGFAVPATDAAPEPRIPWRRFWARTLDQGLCSMLLMLVASLVFHAVNPNAGQSLGWNLLSWIATIALTMLIEPVLLSRLGTTPGKWIFGIRVTDPEGGLLTLHEARWRTIGVLSHGLAFFVPFLHLYFGVRSFFRNDRGEPLPWEDNSVFTVRDTKNWRYAAFALALAASIAVSVLSILLSMGMPNRGELTVAELAQNYNRAAKYYDTLGEFKLEKDGSWAKRRTGEGVTYLADGEEYIPPALVFEEHDGVVTGVFFEGDVPTSLNIGRIEACLACAFAGAQKGAGLLHRDVTQIMNRLILQYDGVLADDVHGVHIERNVEHYSTKVPTMSYTYASGEVTWGTTELTQTRQRVAFTMTLTG